MAPNEEDRASLTLAEFVDLLERRTGHVVEDLASSRKTVDLIDGRVELTLLGISRYGFRSTELAEIINKHSSSLTGWLNVGLSLEREDPILFRRINRLDQQISAATRNNE